MLQLFDVRGTIFSHYSYRVLLINNICIKTGICTRSSQAIILYYSIDVPYRWLMIRNISVLSMLVITASAWLLVPCSEFKTLSFRTNNFERKSDILILYDWFFFHSCPQTILLLTTKNLIKIVKRIILLNRVILQYNIAIYNNNIHIFHTYLTTAPPSKCHYAKITATELSLRRKDYSQNIFMPKWPYKLCYFTFKYQKHSIFAILISR